MAHFRATIQGQRGQASRLGSPKSGISARINGWNGGIRVSAYRNDAGEDVFLVYATGGSNARVMDKAALAVTSTPDGPRVEVLNG